MSTIRAGQVISFMQMLHAFQRIERVMHVPGEDRFENDVEHSYLLAMCAWLAIDAFGLKLDRDKAIRYALAHDLVEVYAGDTYIFSEEPDATAKKKEKEAAARKRLRTEWPALPALHEAMERYELQDDPESVFVRALDKVMPVLTNYVQDGRTFKDKKVTYSQIVDHKRATTARSPEVTDLLEQLIALIDADRGRFFGDLTT
jgi:putative hydrolase of HD superfamily